MSLVLRFLEQQGAERLAELSLGAVYASPAETGTSS